MSLRRAIPTATVACSIVVLGACGAAARSATKPVAPVSALAPAPGGGCGAQAAQTLANAAGLVAMRIYAEELSGSETRKDQRQVESNGPLLRALAGGSTTAVRAAVATLVFSHTHIVRLRVTRGTRVLADVGGPYILAPVGGPLRLNGRTVGRYVLSVQDDLGYVKLVTRFLDVPLVMRAGNRNLPVEGLLAPGPASIPDHGPVSYRGASMQAFSFPARSFPGGPLRVSLLVSVPAGLQAKSCAQIRSEELGHAAQLISRRFKLAPSTFSTFVQFARTLTGGLLYVRAGSRQLAGSTRPGPRRLPASGAVSYRGRRYQVSSFSAPSAVGTVRVYQLVR